MIALLAQIPTQVAAPSNTLDFSLLFIKMLGALGIVVVLAILVLKFLVPRLSFTRRSKFKIFEVQNRFTLEPKKNLYLLRIANRYVVLGATDNSIQLLTELKAEEIEHFAAEQAEEK